MSNRLLLTGWLMLGSLLCAALAQPRVTPAAVAQASPASPYFGQPLPGLTPERFAPGVVSTDAIELNGVFAPDLKEFFFARLIDGVQTMHQSVLVEGAWSAPRPLFLFPGQTRAVADDMTVSPDGRELYFLGVHPHPYSTGTPNTDIWRSRRIDGRWATAEVVPAPISTEASEVYPVIVGDGSLYFSSNRPGGMGRSSLYRAKRLADGRFAEPVLVAPPINSESGLGDVYVSPDERYMVFSSGRPPGLGGSDLFVSFWRPDGTWSEPANLGNTINTDQTDFCPMVTPDGKFLFFSRRRGASWKEATAADVYWVDARILERFNPQEPRKAEDNRPRFDRVVKLEETGATSANVSLGDLNGDGHVDALLVKGRHWPLPDRVLMGDGKGGFAPAQDLGPASDRSYSGLLVDLDRDGDLDVVVSNDLPDPKLVYLNEQNGRFRVGSTFGRPEWSTRNVSVADLNGDDLPDIVVANRAPEPQRANYICLNRGGGRFDDDCTAFSRESATTITPADMNGDGRIDLVVPHRDGGQSHVYVREAGSDLRFRQIPFGPATATIRMTATADFDGDGRVDIVAIDERQGATVYYGESQGGYAAGAPISSKSPTPYALAAADLDLDGRTDILVGHVEAPSTVYFNDGSRHRFVPVSFGDRQGTVYGFSVADVNEDGRPDIAVARSDAPNVLYLASPPRRSIRQLDSGRR